MAIDQGADGVGAIVSAVENDRASIRAITRITANQNPMHRVVGCWSYIPMDMVFSATQETTISGSGPIHLFPVR